MSVKRHHAARVMNRIARRLAVEGLIPGHRWGNPGQMHRCVRLGGGAGWLPVWYVAGWRKCEMRDVFHRGECNCWRRRARSGEGERR